MTTSEYRLLHVYVFFLPSHDSRMKEVTVLSMSLDDWGGWPTDMRPCAHLIVLFHAGTDT